MQKRRITWTWEEPEAQRVFMDWVGFPGAEETKREVDLIERLAAVPHSARILDVGCGTGRHAVEFAKRGHRVLGIDVADTFLTVARAEVRRNQVDVELRFQKASELEETRRFDFALAFNHTLGFMKPDELVDHFRAIRSALVPEGVFLLVLAGPKRTPFWPPMTERNWGERDGEFILSEKSYEGDFRVERNLLIDPDADEIIEFEERQRALSLDEVQTLLENAGFVRLGRYADLAGAAASREKFGVFTGSVP